MFYANPQAIARIYSDVFSFGEKTEAMYCFTDSMRPFVQGPFSDEIRNFFDAQGVELLGHACEGQREPAASTVPGPGLVRSRAQRW